MRAFFPVSAARLGHTIRPGRSAEKMSIPHGTGRQASVREKEENDVVNFRGHFWKRVLQSINPLSASLNYFNG